MRDKRYFAMIALMVVTVACGEDSEPSDGGEPVTSIPDEVTDDEESGTQYLTPTDHLVRASMALRGERPSVSELQEVHANPAAIEGIVDSYMETEAFGETIREMHNEALQLRPFLFWFPTQGEFVDETLVSFNRSVLESPLRLIEHVVMNNRPYSEIVTADYTLADDKVAGVWGMAYEGSGEWVETRWPEEGRPHAGVLSESMFYVRHYSSPLNAQRSRANAMTRAFLCYDFLKNGIDVDGNVDLSDPEKIKNAVKTPACATCHDDLDPLAALFWRHEFFVSPATIESYPYTHYRPDYETIYRPRYSDREPAYFGKQVGDIKELGLAISEDPRFVGCAVKRFFSYLAQVPEEAVPFEAASSLRAEFVESGLNARTLAKAVVLSDAFRASHVIGSETEDDRPYLQKVRPRQWNRMMLAMIGYRWDADFQFPLDFLGGGIYGRVDLMTDSLLGYEVLAGGVDDYIVTAPVHTINPTASLVFDSFAQEAAGFVVDRDLGDGPPSLNRLLTVGLDADDAALRLEMSRLHLKLFAEFVTPDSEDVTASMTLYQSALSISNDPRRAWGTLLTAMFQDSRLIYY